MWIYNYIKAKGFILKYKFFFKKNIRTLTKKPQKWWNEKIMWQNGEGTIEDGERSELSKNKEMLVGSIHAYIYVTYSQVLARGKWADSDPLVVTY